MKMFEHVRMCSILYELCHDVGILLELKPDEKRSKITAKDLILGD